MDHRTDPRAMYNRWASMGWSVSLVEQGGKKPYFLVSPVSAAMTGEACTSMTCHGVDEVEAFVALKSRLAEVERENTRMHRESHADFERNKREGITVREACRRRMALGGADAECLEHALVMTEQERDAALSDAAHAEEMSRNDLALRERALNDADAMEKRESAALSDAAALRAVLSELLTAEAWNDPGTGIIETVGTWIDDKGLVARATALAAGPKEGM